MLEYARISPVAPAAQASPAPAPWYEIGIDEVGRGCLLGPMLAAAVVLPPPDAIEQQVEMWSQIKDSKKVSEKKRGVLSAFIREACPVFGFGWKTVEEIDSLNILQATMKAMHSALDESLRKLAASSGIGNAYIWIDGNAFRTYQAPSSQECESGREREWRLYPECLVNGDNIRLAVAAASIIAKDERDRYMKQLEEMHPELEHYAIKKNKGYGTKAHLDGIRTHGYTRFHRRSFHVKSLSVL